MTRLTLSLALAAASLAGAAALLTPAADAALPGTAFSAGKAFTAEFGSKRLTGYFMPQDGACALTLMIAESVDPDYARSPAARVQVAVAPGNGTLIGSGEGTAVSVTCASDAASVTLSKTQDGV